MTHHPRNPRFATVAVAVTIVVLSALLGAHLWAARLDRQARDNSRPLPERSAAAETAARLEPFNERFAVTRAILAAETHLAAGRVDEAYFTLLPLSTTVRGDDLFTRTYQRTLALKIPIDARKAHQQHAKEKAGGALDPEDVER